ncbi:MAG: hybrid sensor histidine kinase/response regulator [Candidatus Saccharibacteria bacterium]|nr:hybrid sensor histidine kinase/response regulator [Moraxellaceae bacterium]
MNGWLVFGALGCYVLLLFVCAFLGERKNNGLSHRWRMALFSLTLGVYCTSWTYYGAVGAGVRDGMSFLPIYLGPLLFLWLGRDIWQRLVQIRNRQSITSIADFIAARYGKSPKLAAMVTVCAVICILPYLALQLRAIALSVDVLLSDQANIGMTSNGVLLLTGLLAGLAMVFGSRHLTNSEQHSGLMLAIALESMVKLIALMVIACFAMLHLDSGHLLSVELSQRVTRLQTEGLPSGFWTQTLLAGLAMICLPRQFHVGVVECRDLNYVHGARRWFAVYLLLTVLAIIPIILWASHMPISLLPNPDTAVLMLPLMNGETGLALLAFLGGFSAATGMLLVATVTLSIMLSNDLILPLLWHFNLVQHSGLELEKVMRVVRRLSMLTVMLLGFLAYRLFANATQLSAIGLLAFAGVVQFAPALIGGLYWRGGSKSGVMAGLIAGFVLWAYTLLLPSLVSALSGHLSLTLQSAFFNWQTEGLFGISLLRPEALLGFSGHDPLTHGVFWSLGVNLALYIWISRRYRPTVSEQMQAAPFLQPDELERSLNQRLGTRESSTVQMSHTVSRQTFTIGDLAALAERISGTSVTQKAFTEFAQHLGEPLDQQMRADRRWWQFTEQLLAGAIGSASARTLLTTALRDNGLGVAQVAALLDQASQWQRFNQQLLLTMMDNLTHGVSVVDSHMCLVAWNRRYLELFNYPTDLVYVGCPVADLIRYNAERGECGPGSVESHIQKRLNWLRAGNAHVFERVRANNQVIEMRGQPISGGGFVTTFADITQFRQTEAALEARVMERTEQLELALYEQKIARIQADKANSSKSHFVAAASHDLLQPMHAARLFSGVLEQGDLNESDQQTLKQLDRALHGAESILSALLEIARLDSDTLQPNLAAVDLNALLTDLESQFAPIAVQRGLVLHVHPTRLWVNSDPQWLRRIIQNLLSNALRYTAEGRVVVGVLGHASQDGYLRLGVWDSGFGIDAAQQKLIFQEFQRGKKASPWGEQGLGLGLAIVERMATRLAHPLKLYSTLGKGSCFMLTLPIAQPVQQRPVSTKVGSGVLHGLRVLCVDNDVAILEAMHILLQRWGCEVVIATHPSQAIELAKHAELHHRPIQVWLVDQHLDAYCEGLDLIRMHAKGCSAALITADSDPDLPERTHAEGAVLLKKPLKPAALRAFLMSVRVN